MIEKVPRRISELTRRDLLRRTLAGMLGLSVFTGDANGAERDAGIAKVLGEYDVEVLGKESLTGFFGGDFYYPVWSPDGRKIAYLDRHSICVIDTDAIGSSYRGKRVEELKSYFTRSLSWSPDGRKIAFSASVGNSEASNSIYSIDTDGNNLEILTRPDSGIEDSEPAWSPDSREIAFSRGPRLGNHCIMLMKAKGSHQRTILSRSGEDFQHPSWSPDGKRIAIASTICNDQKELERRRKYRRFLYEINEKDRRLYHIFSFNPDDNGLKQITSGGILTSFCQPSYSPDGKKIVCCYAEYAESMIESSYNSHAKRSNICVMDANGKNIRALTKPQSYWSAGGPIPIVSSQFYFLDTSPSWSPDGRSIAFSSVGGYGGHIYVMKLRLVERK